MSGYREIYIFSGRLINDYFSLKKEEMKDLINNEKREYLLQINEDEYVKHIFDKFQIDTLNILFDDQYGSKSEQMILASKFPPSFVVRRGMAYKKTVLTVHIPIEGNIELFYYTPSPFITRSVLVRIANQEITFDVIIFEEDERRIKEEIDDTVSLIERQLKSINKNVEQYNEQLHAIIINTFKRRKEEIIQNDNFVNSIGIPIKPDNEEVNKYTVPPPKLRKKIKINKPVVKYNNSTLKPTLDSTTYSNILRIIQDVGKQFEKYPSTYKDKGEEDLRDHILLVLQPNFEGTAAGEAFNKGGKTDILLSYKGSNVFVAECKFWKGVKSFNDAIDQLIGYLTWRDTKTSLIIFVRNKNISSVFKTIETEIDNHPNFVKFINKVDKNWYNYTFHLVDDNDATFSLAVLVFHIPDTD